MQINDVASPLPFHKSLYPLLYPLKISMMSVCFPRHLFRPENVDVRGQILQRSTRTSIPELPATTKHTRHLPLPNGRMAQHIYQHLPYPSSPISSRATVGRVQERVVKANCPRPALRNVLHPAAAAALNSNSENHPVLARRKIWAYKREVPWGRRAFESYILHPNEPKCILLW